MAPPPVLYPSPDPLSGSCHNLVLRTKGPSQIVVKPPLLDMRTQRGHNVLKVTASSARIQVFRSLSSVPCTVSHSTLLWWPAIGACKTSFHAISMTQVEEMCCPQNVLVRPGPCSSWERIPRGYPGRKGNWRRPRVPVQGKRVVPITLQL